MDAFLLVIALKVSFVTPRLRCAATAALWGEPEPGAGGSVILKSSC